MYFDKELKANTKNPRKTWELIQSLLHVKPKTSPTLNSINHNGTLINDQNAITNCLNNYKTDNKNSFLKYPNQPHFIFNFFRTTKHK